MVAKGVESAESAKRTAMAQAQIWQSCGIAHPVPSTYCKYGVPPQCSRGQPVQPYDQGTMARDSPPPRAET